MRQRSLDELRVNGLGRYLPLRAGLTHVIEEGQDDQAAILLVVSAVTRSGTICASAPNRQSMQR